MKNIDSKADLFKKIVKLGRPQYLVGDFLIFTMGALLAILISAPFVLNKFLLGYVILMLAHLSVHYSNDYFDSELDKFNNPTPISGGSGILVENPELKEFSKWFSIALMSLSVSLAALFIIIFNYPLSYFLFLLFGNLLAWFYTAPPVKLAYRNLGELGNIIAVIIFLGAGYFTLMGTLNLPFWIFCIPIIFFQLIFICSFEIPDMEGDKLGGKKNLIVSYGRPFGFKIIGISAILATTSFLLIPYLHIFPPNINFQILALISIISVILGIIELIKRPSAKKIATNFAIINVATLFLISFLIDIYFVIIILK